MKVCDISINIYMYTHTFIFVLDNGLGATYLSCPLCSLRCRVAWCRFFTGRGDLHTTNMYQLTPRVRRCCRYGVNKEVVSHAV